MGAAGELRTDQPQLGIWLSPMQINETPLPNNRITFLPMLSAANRPAINQGDIFMDQNLFTTNGAGRRQTWFEIDGSQRQRQLGAADDLHQHSATGRAADDDTDQQLLRGIRCEHGQRREHRDQERGQPHSTAKGRRCGGPRVSQAALSGFNAANAASGNDVASDQLWQESGAVGRIARQRNAVLSRRRTQRRRQSVSGHVASGPRKLHRRVSRLAWLPAARSPVQPEEQCVPARQPGCIFRHEPERNRRRLFTAQRGPRLSVGAPTRPYLAIPLR